MITLWKPEFHADTGRPIVGLAIWKVLQERETVQVEFTLRRKGNGSLVFPHIYEMGRSDMAGYPEEVIHGIRIVKIPLDKFNEVIRR